MLGVFWTPPDTVVDLVLVTDWLSCRQLHNNFQHCNIFLGSWLGVFISSRLSRETLTESESPKQSLSLYHIGLLTTVLSPEKFRTQFHNLPCSKSGWPLLCNLIACVLLISICTDQSRYGRIYPSLKRLKLQTKICGHFGCWTMVHRCDICNVKWLKSWIWNTASCYFIILFIWHSNNQLSFSYIELRI